MDGPRIVAERVPLDARLDVLPRHFGSRLMSMVEGAIYEALSRLAVEYPGSCWHFYELSNGGFYMAPDHKPLRLCVQGNEFDEVLSADGAGVVACLFAFGQLCSVCENDVLIKHYGWLLEYALEHNESSKIVRAID